MDKNTQDFLVRLTAHAEVLRNIEQEEVRHQALIKAGVDAMEKAKVFA